jgi:glutamate dehydrogenase/leucine dehydrogenase
MGFLKSIFGSGKKAAAAGETAMGDDAAWQDTAEVEIPAAAAPEINIDAAEREALERLAESANGTSAEAFGQGMDMESMAALYRLDKLVKLGLVKRSRPMFMQPEVYELTERGWLVVRGQ